MTISPKSRASSGILASGTTEYMPCSTSSLQRAMGKPFSPYELMLLLRPFDRMRFMQHIVPKDALVVNGY
jgi:hypothetical protein